MASTISQTEVVNDIPAGAQPVNTMTVPQVRLNVGQTLQNPCFWMILGAVGAVGAVWLLHKMFKER